MDSHKQKKPDRGSLGISRRDFSRVIALAAATAAVPGNSSAKPTDGVRNGPAPDLNQAPNLTPVAEAQTQIIFAKYGERLNEEQKADVRRLIAAAQKQSEDLHAFHLDNSDEPSMIFAAKPEES